MTVLIGFDATATQSSTLEGKTLNVGTRTLDGSGNEYVYVQASGAITGAGYVCTYDETYQAAMVSTSNDAGGALVGIPQVAFADNDYGWLMVKGTTNIRVAASAAADAALNTTGTAGQIDDDGTADAFIINGLILTTANGGAAAVAAGQVNYPALNVTAIPA
jgi:hypothetical protein